MDAWLAGWIAVHIGLQVFGLFHIARTRHSLGTFLIVKWVTLILVVPIAGVLGYYFFLIERALQRGTPGRRDEAAPFLQPARMSRR